MTAALDEIARENSDQQGVINRRDFNATEQGQRILPDDPLGRLIEIPFSRLKMILLSRLRTIPILPKIFVTCIPRRTRTIRFLTLKDHDRATLGARRALASGCSESLKPFSTGALGPDQGIVFGFSAGRP